MSFDTEARSSSPRSRSWTFTLNNYVEADLTRIIDFSPKYCVIGREVGENGTPHLQGYINFEAIKSLKQLKALIPRGHMAIAKGTAQENYVYCTKEGNFVEHGVRPLTQTEKGAKGAARIAEMWEHAKKGDFEKLPPAQIKQWEYIRSKYGQEQLVDLSSLKNVWIHGPTGCGKSSLVRKIGKPFYSKGMNKWWDGYQNEDLVVLDDFAPEHGKYLGYFLKIWADHYAFNAEVKGGMLKVRPLHIIITSQYPLHACFEEAETVQALNRRFGIWNMDEKVGMDEDFISLFN